MKVLITGSSGFIGSLLVDNLSQEHQIRCLVKEAPHDLFPSDVEVWQGDITSYSTIAGITEKIDIVIHLAAKVGKTSSWKRLGEYERVNVEGTKNLLRESIRTEVSKFIYLSTLSVYDLPALRQEGRKRIKLSTPYELTKYKGESLVRDYASRYSFSGLVVRSAMVYDNKRPAKEFKMLKRLLNLGIVPILGSGTSLINLISRSQLVDRLRLLAEEGDGGVYDYQGETLAINSLLDRLSESDDSRFITIELPHSSLLLLKPLVSCLEELLSSFGFEPPVSSSMLSNLRRS